MARAGAGGPAGRINGRFMLLTVVCAAISAILVYAGIARGGGSSGNEAAPSTTTEATVLAAVDIPARTQVTAEMVQVKDVPLEGRAATALSSIDDVVGKVTRYPIALDEQVTPTKIVSLEGGEAVDSLSFVVPKGMRAISISADQVLSAGGLVLPGDYVDIIAVFDVKNAQGAEEDAYLVRTILQNVQVLAVAQTIADAPAAGEDTSDGQSSRDSEAKPNPDATTLTILVTPEQAEFVFLAESNGTLRGVLRGYGDTGMDEPRPIIETELFPAGMAPPPTTGQ
jgi:pilus assembly protein CpaB